MPSSQTKTKASQASHYSRVNGLSRQFPSPMFKEITAGRPYKVRENLI